MDGPTERVPIIRQSVLDTEDVRALAEFYRVMFGLRYRPGDELEAGGDPDWLVLIDPAGHHGLAFQQVEQLTRPSWPDGEPPQMMHLDTTVDTVAELEHQKNRALGLGASVLLDRADDEREPLYVFADPAGHPFCIFVSTDPSR